WSFMLSLHDALPIWVGTQAVEVGVVVDLHDAREAGLGSLLERRERAVRLALQRVDAGDVVGRDRRELRERRGLAMRLERGVEPRSEEHTSELQSREN